MATKAGTGGGGGDGRRFGMVVEVMVVVFKYTVWHSGGW